MSEPRDIIAGYIFSDFVDLQIERLTNLDKFRQISIESNTKQRKTDAKKAKMEEFIERWKQTAAGKRV